MNNPLLDAHRALTHVIDKKRSLNEAMQVKNVTHSLSKHICFGVCRYYFQLNAILDQLVEKPLRRKDRDITLLLLMGLYQIIHLNKHDASSVNNTVACCNALKKSWARGLVNGVLRQFLRDEKNILGNIEKNIEANYVHPQWLIKKIQQAWPDDWQTILETNNQQAPMHLRVNLSRTSREDYVKQLQSQEQTAMLSDVVPTGITLESACPVERLPDFGGGLVSVQDLAAQCAAPLLQLSHHCRVLDACAAPGGKSGHMLESANNIDLVCVDNQESRLEKVKDTLQRLNFQASLCCADASDTTAWWDGQPFERILLDAPCSATGVIRRHPDIKLLRQAEDMGQYPAVQLSLLTALWPLLNTDGILLYATCSIMPAENDGVIAAFCEQHEDAELLMIDVDWGHATEYGRQVLPGEHEMDGFYYARLRKR